MYNTFVTNIVAQKGSFSMITVAELSLLIFTWVTIYKVYNFIEQQQQQQKHLLQKIMSQVYCCH